MRKIILSLFLLLPAMLMAKRINVSDTLWLNNDYEKVTANLATVIGIVQSVDQETNEMTMHCYSREDMHLLSVQRRTFSFYGLGMKTGKQIFYDADGHVQMEEEYMLYDDPKGRKLSRLTTEILFNPDGSKCEDVTFVYKTVKGNEQQFYVRQCYYPNGTLRYKETMTEKGRTTQYFDANGKKDKQPEQVYELYLTLPEFPGGEKELNNFLNKTIKYPQVARDMGVQGRALVQFTVDKDGAIGDAKVISSGGHPSLNTEAVRVVYEMPNWKPGTKRGKPIRVKYTMPVNFKLQ